MVLAPGFTTPAGVADPIAPGRRPGERAAPTVAPRRGATTLSAPPILRPLRGRLWIMGSPFPGSSTPGYRIFDASGVAPMGVSPAVAESVHAPFSRGTTPPRATGDEVFPRHNFYPRATRDEMVAGGWFVPPDHDRLPAAQTIRGLPAMEEVAGDGSCHRVHDPGGVADPISPGRRPGERAAPTVAPRRGATTLSAAPILRPLRGRLWIMHSSFPGSSTPG
jgi:hypothetical protein